MPDITRFGRTDEDGPHRLWLEQFDSQKDPRAQKLVRSSAVIVCPHFQEIGTYDFGTGRFTFFGFGIVAEFGASDERVYFHPPAVYDSLTG